MYKMIRFAMVVVSLFVAGCERNKSISDTKDLVKTRAKSDVLQPCQPLDFSQMEMQLADQKAEAESRRVSTLLDYETLPAELASTKRRLVRYEIPTKGNVTSIQLWSAVSFKYKDLENAIKCGNNRNETDREKFTFVDKSLVIEGCVRYCIDDISAVAREAVRKLGLYDFMSCDVRPAKLFLE